VLAVRTFLILAVTRTLTGLSAKPQLAATFPPALSIALIGAAIPLYLLQAGIKHTEPITAAIVPSLPPPAAYLLPLPAGQLKAPALTLAGVLAIVILVARHDARNGSSSASQSAAATADPARPPEHAEPEDRHEMPIVVEGSAVPVHSIAFRASSPKQAQELARFAAPFGGAFSPPGTRSGRPRPNVSDTVYQVRLPL
jgi:hypothetical protein